MILFLHLGLIFYRHTLNKDRTVRQKLRILADDELPALALEEVVEEFEFTLHKRVFAYGIDTTYKRISTCSDLPISTNNLPDGNR